MVGSSSSQIMVPDILSPTLLSGLEFGSSVVPYAILNIEEAFLLLEEADIVIESSFSAKIASGVGIV